jgi:dipeptidase
MIAAGKKATADGSVLVARSPDALGDCAEQILAVPRKEHENDEVIEFKLSQNLKISQVPETYAYIGLMHILEGEDLSTAHGGINEFQVTAGASTGGLLNSKALEVCPRMPKSIGDYRCTLVLERCKTAREGVKLVGELAEKYGARTDNYIIGDPEEAWIYEEFKGKLWAAARIPDDSFFVEANTFNIREIDLKDKKNFLGAKNLEEFAVENGLYDPDKDGAFNLTKVYGAVTGKIRHGIPAPEYDRRRRWRSTTLLAPSLGLKPEESWDPDYFPVFVKPDEKITPKDFLMMLTDHYQGTPYDLYGVNKHKYKSTVSAMRTGRGVTGEDAHQVDLPRFEINENRQYQLAPIWGKERLIGTARAATTWCAQLRSWMPNPIGGVLWAGLSEGATSGRLPWYVGMTKTPEPYTIGIQKEGPIASKPFLGSIYNEESAFWVFRVVTNLVNLFYTATKGEVIPVWRKWEDKLYELQPVVEKAALALYKEDPKLAVEFLTSYSNSKALEALEMAREMTVRLHTIIAHYNAPL